MQDTQSPAILEAFAEGASGPRDIAARAGISLADLGRWLSDADNRRPLEGLLRLSRMSAAMVLCRYHTLAAATLAQLLSEAPATELARKACADLLGAELLWPPRGGWRSDDDSTAAARQTPLAALGAAPPGEDAILRALEALGRDDDPEADTARADA
jgi:hypothetical protein